MVKIAEFFSSERNALIKNRNEHLVWFAKNSVLEKVDTHKNQQVLKT
jgi:hypothetical protein